MFTHKERLLLLSLIETGMWECISIEQQTLDVDNLNIFSALYKKVEKLSCADTPITPEEYYAAKRRVEDGETPIPGSREDHDALIEHLKQGTRRSS